MSGIDAMIAIRTEFPDARVIVLTTFEGDVEIHRALAAGARAYVLKSIPPKELVEVIRQVNAGKNGYCPKSRHHLAQHCSDDTLTAREIEVLQQSPTATAIAALQINSSFRKERSKFIFNTSWRNSSQAIAHRRLP